MVKTAGLVLLLSTRVFADVAVSQGSQVAIGDSAIAFEQNGRVLSISDGVVKLKQAPFVVRLSLPVGGGLLIHAWTDDLHQQRVKQGRKLDEAFPYEANAMAEYPANKNHDWFISSDRYSYWHYADKGDHRFDKVKVQGKRVIGRRTVEKLIAIPEERKITPGAVYLVLIRQDKQLSRATLRLEFARP